VTAAIGKLRVQDLQRRHFLKVQLAGTTDGTTGERTLWFHLPSFEKGPNAIGSFLWHEVVKLKTSGGPGKLHFAVFPTAQPVRHRLPRSPAARAM
jgi:hypothetical protein